MNIAQLNKKFGTQAKCLDYLEKLRWGKVVTCPYCNSTNTRRLKGNIHKINCNSCKSQFTVLVRTIFEHTHLELPKWFLQIFLMLNAKMGISAKEIAGIVDLYYKTAWYAAMRIRCGMIDTCHTLQNLVEMDEAYVGGKPRKRYSKEANNVPNISQVYNKRGRGTRKTPVVGIVERNGKIVLKVIEKLTSRNLLSMLEENVKTDNAVVITDDFRSYNKFDNVVEHLVIEHSKGVYAKGAVHTNTMEGFFSILKNSIRGNYRALSKKYLPFYLVQAQFIYNSRNHNGDLFEDYIRAAVNHSKCLTYYKPKGESKKIVYKHCKKERN
jgi:transposase-like protein